ncbi:MAG: metallophosphoesterase [Candidatus Latescibacteria bacterium]|nr:metallophosphoesterase [Candidatus Latescibacterota bacterium]
MIFFLIAFSILSAFYGYIGWRLIIPAGLSMPWNLVLWIVLFLFMLMPFISILIRIAGYNPGWINIFSWIAYLSLGFFSLVFVFLFARDFVQSVVFILQKAAGIAYSFINPEVQSPDPVNPDRHRFLVNAFNMVTLGAAGLLSGYGLYEARRSQRIVEVTIPLKNLPHDLDGFRIVQITDIHVGPTIKRGYVQKIVDKVNSLEKDTIVLTGDLVDGLVQNLRDDVAPLAELSAPGGMYFVTGNHEYYSGVEAWIEEVKRLGFTVLLNEHTILKHGDGRILLAGVTDFDGGHMNKIHVSSPEAALSGAPPNDVKILLAHQPRSIFKASQAGFDLVLSGHTHGGQYFPWNYLVYLQQPYNSGLHKHDNTWIYVSKGTGYWGPPLRIGRPSEITVITLSAVSFE